MTQAVKRACDACHRRKVKCDGVNPCRNCSSAQLSCTYNAIPQKKGPKGSRAKVISELRETQRQTSLTAKVHNRMNGIPCPPEPIGGSPSPGMLSLELAKDCIDFYFTNLYEKAPILDQRRIEQQLPFMEQDRDVYCLLTALCGFIMLQPGMSIPAGEAFGLDLMPGTNIVASQLLLDECLRVRKGYEYLDSPSMDTLATSFFLFGCYHGIELHEKAWLHLREASTMIQLNGLHKEESYAQMDVSESSRRRRLYWMLYVLERAHAIQRQRPLTLQATIKPPSAQDDPSDPQAHQLNAFVTMVQLFQSFDDAFTGVWAKARGNLPSQHVSNLQKQLNDMLPNYLCQDGQLSDLNVNQQWLKSTHWQLTNGRINSQSGDGIDWQVPQDLSRELLMKMASQFPGQGMEVFGSGLIPKLFDIATTMTEFLANQPASRDPFTAGPREYLNQLLNVVGILRHGNHHLLPLLFSKINEVLPRLTNPMLQNAPENCTLGNIDIFDGFGNAGMAQPPSSMHIQMDAEYDRKFSVADYDDYSDMNGMGSGSDSATGSTGPSMPAATSSDMNSPFAVSSPSVMSPGLEFSRQELNNFCNPMQEMVNPMGSNMNGMNSQQGQHQQHQRSHHMLQSQYMSQQAAQPTLRQHHNHNGLPQSQSMGNFNSPATPTPPGMNTATMPSAHPIGQGLSTNGNGMTNQIPRQQPPNRANSFAMPQGGQIPRTVGDFHALQRSNTGDLNTLGGMGGTAEMDFAGMR